MKKILSVILVVSLMMSLFCVVPASAEFINTWPYYLEDFEDNANSMQSNVTATIVSPGANGSQYAGQYTVPVSGDRNLKLIAGTTTNLLQTGDTIKITADIKFGSAINKTSSYVYLHYLGSKSNTSTYTTPNTGSFEDNGFVAINGARVSWTYNGASTEWQKASYEGVYAGKDVYIDGGMGVSIQLTSVGTEYTVTIDNVEFQIIKDTKMDSEPATRVIYKNDFSEDMSGITYVGTNATGSGLSLTDGGVLRMVDTDSTKQSEGGHVKFQLNIGEALKTNKYYLLTYKTRVVEAKDNSSGTPVTFATSQTTKHRWSFDNGLMYEENSQIKCDGNWAYVKILFNYSSDTKDTFEDGVFDFRWWIKYDGTGSDTAIYEFDNFKFEEVGGLVDGGWEYKVLKSDSVSNSGTTVVYKEVDETSNSTVLTGVTPTLKEWTSVSGGSYTINYNLNTTTKKSGKNSATLYFHKIDGTAYHKASACLDAGQNYRFSVWLRPCAITSAGTLEVGMNYTYTDGKAADSVVLRTIATSSSKSSIFQEYTADFKAPANMATAELYVKQIDTVGADQNIDRFTNSGNLAYYTDDWTFTKLPSDNIPTVTASATTTAGGIVAIDKNTTAPAGVTVKLVVKLTATKDGVKTYIASTTGTAITVPEKYRTGYTLAAEITPVASNGYIGKPVAIEVPAVPVVVGTTFTATAATGATLESAEAMSGIAIWGAYDANGEMLDWASAPMTVTAGGTQTVAVPSDFDATGATEVKVMLWEDMTNCKPLVDCVAYNLS